MAWQTPNPALDLADTAQFMQAAAMFGVDLTTDHQEKAKLVLEFATRHYDSEKARIEATEKKAQMYFTGLVAGAGIILGNYQAIVKYLTGPTFAATHVLRCLGFALAFVLWGYAAFCAYVALGIEKYKGYPDAREILGKSRSQFLFHVREALALTLSSTIVHNSTVTSGKAFRLRAAHVAVLISSSAIVVSLLDYVRAYALTVR